MRKVCVLLILAVAGMAQAVPALQPGETYQCWQFSDPRLPAVPEIDQNPNGDPVAVISSPFQLMWDNGAWSSQAMNIVIDLPNFPPQNPYKLVYVEMVYMGDVTLSWVQDNLGKDFVKVSSVITDIAGTPWKKISDVWRVEPNPPFEKLCYGVSGTTAAAAIDGICIRTFCVPEPLTLSLLGLGSLVLFRRK